MHNWINPAKLFEYLRWSLISIKPNYLFLANSLEKYLSKNFPSKWKSTIHIQWIFNRNLNNHHMSIENCFIYFTHIQWKYKLWCCRKIINNFFPWIFYFWWRHVFCIPCGPVKIPESFSQPLLFTFFSLNRRKTLFSVLMMDFLSPWHWDVKLTWLWTNKELK